MGAGWIDLNGGRAELSAGPETPDLQLWTSSDDVAYLEDVIGRHLVRFGARDELVVRWIRFNGKPGTVQEHPGD